METACSGNKLRGYIVSRSSCIFSYVYMWYLQTDLYQSEFESRHLNNMNVSDYLTTTQMEISGTWGTEVEVIALSTLLKTAIAIYYHPPGCKSTSLVSLFSLCSDVTTFICTILETILTVSRLSQVVFNFPFMQSVHATSCYLVEHFYIQHCINYIISLQHQLFPN